MKALMTGGDDFRGSYFVEALIRKGETVWVLDDLLWFKKSQAASDSPNLELVKSDCRDAVTQNTFEKG